MNVLNGDEVAVGSTTTTLLVMTDKPAGSLQEFTIEVTVGTVQIGIDTVASASYANPVGAKRVFTCANGRLAVKCGTSGSKFVISA